MKVRCIDTKGYIAHPAYTLRSGPVRERPEYHSRAANAGTFGPSLPLQFALQLPGYRIPVWFLCARSPEWPWLMGTRRYLVVDLMNGGDLRFHISRKTFTEDAVRFWMSELACALRYIHGQGIVHRDLKPDNVLLDSDGHLHLADFVGSKKAFSSSIPLTVGRMLLPTFDRISCYIASLAHWRIWHPRFTRELGIRARSIGGPWV